MCSMSWPLWRTGKPKREPGSPIVYTRSARIQDGLSRSAQNNCGNQSTCTKRRSKRSFGHHHQRVERTDDPNASANKCAESRQYPLCYKDEAGVVGDRLQETDYNSSDFVTTTHSTHFKNARRSAVPHALGIREIEPPVRKRGKR